MPITESDFATTSENTGRRLLIDVGNTKTALLLKDGERCARRGQFPTRELSATAIKDWLMVSATPTSGAGYSVAEDKFADLSAEIAAANAVGAGRKTAEQNIDRESAVIHQERYAGKVKSLAPLAPAPVFVSSVVPAVNSQLEEWLNACGWDDVTFADPARRHIIDHNLVTPETTGSDRLLAAWAAYYLREINPRREAVVVVQAGSAAVVDLVSREGIFQGGAIMPGPQMWLDTLSAAARLPRLAAEEMDWESPLPGNNTTSAIYGGAVAGLIGEIKEAVRRTLFSLKGQVPLIVFTGGWGERLLPFFPGKYYSDLVLRGLEGFACNYKRG